MSRSAAVLEPVQAPPALVCGPCGQPAEVETLDEANGRKPLLACKRCAADDGGLGAQLGGWIALRPPPAVPAWVAAMFRGTGACSSREAREVVQRVPHPCATCGATLPAGALVVVVTVGSHSARGSAYFCAWPAACGSEAVGWCGSLEEVAPDRAWKAARSAIGAAETPADVPAWVWARFGPVPF